MKWISSSFLIAETYSFIINEFLGQRKRRDIFCTWALWKLSNNTSSISIFKQITQCFLLECKTLLLCHSEFRDLLSFWNRLCAIGESKVQFESKKCFLAMTVTSESGCEPKRGAPYSSQGTHSYPTQVLCRRSIMFIVSPLPREIPRLLQLSLRSCMKLLCDANSYGQGKGATAQGLQGRNLAWFCTWE